jgi:hypothetical protein
MAKSNDEIAIMRNEYITTKINQKDLAKKYSLSVVTLNKYATSENWFELREVFLNQLKTSTIKQVSVLKAELLAEGDIKVIECAKKLLVKVEAMISKANNITVAGKIANCLQKIQEIIRKGLALDENNDTNTKDINIKIDLPDESEFKEDDING